MLILDNPTISKVLTMEMTMAALEASYLGIARGTATCRPRIDISIPTSDPGRTYRWGTMEGGSTDGYFAIRMKSDIIHYETNPDGSRRQEKFCHEPGLFCGLILLTSVETGTPLAFINDGVLQHLRVGADGGLGVKYMARDDAEVVGMLGSGGMANTFMMAICTARPIRKLQVFSPTPARREDFAARMRARHGIEVQVCDAPDLVYRGADIVAGCTNATAPVLDGDLLESGTHVLNVGAGGLPDARTLERVDAYLRFGDTPNAEGMDAPISDEHLTWKVRRAGETAKAKRAHGVMLPEKRVTLAELASGARPGRTSDDQITWSERGNLQGAQFFAVAGAAYEAAVAQGLGREIPTEWFLQDVRN